MNRVTDTVNSSTIDILTMNPRERGHDHMRVLALASAIVGAETLLYSVLAPLLPDFETRLGLSGAQTGLLGGAFPLGWTLMTIPAAVLSLRVGVKTTATVGVGVLAATSVAFGLADGWWPLIATRLLQGAGGAAASGAALVWLIDAAPHARRAELLGIALAAGAAGQIAGPALGGVAAVAGRVPVFAATALAGALLTLVALRFPAPPRHPHEALRLRATLTAPGVPTAIGLTAVPALLIGALLVLAPLRLDRLGADAAAIAVTFGVSAALGVVTRPLAGRWADRHGPLRAIRAGLVASTLLLLAIGLAPSRWPATAAVAAGVVTLGLFWAPTLVLLADACQRLGIGQVVTIAINNLAWAPAGIAGAAIAGVLSQTVGTGATCVLLAAVPVAALALVLARGDPQPQIVGSRH